TTGRLGMAWRCILVVMGCRSGVCGRNRAFAVLGAVLAFACSRADAHKREEDASSSKQVAVAPAAIAPSASGSAPAPSASAAAPEPESLEEEPDVEPATLEEQKAALIARMGRALKLTDDELRKVEAIFLRSKPLSQGN